APPAPSSSASPPTADRTAAPAPQSTSASTTAASTATSLEVDDAASASAPATRECVTIFFTVRPGDSWLGIAAYVQVAVADLYEVNGATASTPLYPNETICLPWNAKVPKPEPPTTTAAAPTTSSPA